MSRKRRLVPMPPDARGDRPNSAAAPAPLAALKTWHAFAFLILTAIALYYAKWPILVIAALVGLFSGFFWLCRRFPKTMFFLVALIRGLTRRR